MWPWWVVMGVVWGLAVLEAVFLVVFTASRGGTRSPLEPWQRLWARMVRVHWEVPLRVVSGRYRQPAEERCQLLSCGGDHGGREITSATGLWQPLPSFPAPPLLPPAAPGRVVIDGNNNDVRLADGRPVEVHGHNNRIEIIPLEPKVAGKRHPPGKSAYPPAVAEAAWRIVWEARYVISAKAASKATAYQNAIREMLGMLFEAEALRGDPPPSTKADAALQDSLISAYERLEPLARQQASVDKAWERARADLRRAQVVYWVDSANTWHSAPSVNSGVTAGGGGGGSGAYQVVCSCHGRILAQCPDAQPGGDDGEWWRCPCHGWRPGGPVQPPEFDG